jgi:F-type H+-transporting ATPase subunit delta
MSQTANRYAKALFDTAQEQNNLEAVAAALTNIASLTLELKDFRLFLDNPLLSFEERGAILKSLFEGKVPDLVYRFLLFITHKNRLNILQSIIEAFDGLYLSSTNQLRALVKTAFPLRDEDKAFINQRLQDKFKLHMVTQWNLDPSLLGGFCIYTGTQVFDYSFKSQLNHFLTA